MPYLIVFRLIEGEESVSVEPPVEPPPPPPPPEPLVVPGRSPVAVVVFPPSTFLSPATVSFTPVATVILVPGVSIVFPLALTVTLSQRPLPEIVTLTALETTDLTVAPFARSTLASSASLESVTLVTPEFPSTESTAPLVVTLIFTIVAPTAETAASAATLTVVILPDKLTSVEPSSTFKVSMEVVPVALRETPLPPLKTLTLPNLVLPDNIIEFVPPPRISVTPLTETFLRVTSPSPTPSAMIRLPLIAMSERVTPGTFTNTLPSFKVADATEVAPVVM